ncbi:MAG: hypothetical protein M1355_02405 [Patescibacteria group bacterium]|nr:hypothetical protein [Patescibacteria group bacterium]
MNNEKWQDTLDNISRSFGIEEKFTEEDNIEDDFGNQVKGVKEVVIFNNPIGKIRLERTKRPLIEDKKMHYHKGAGGVAKVEFIVSDTEFTYKLRAFVWDKDTDEWKELDTKAGPISF